MTQTRSAAPAPGTVPGLGWWHAAQAIGVVLTVALLVGFVVRPDTALAVLWNVLIPLVPASLLISPALWRGTCPLATLHMLTNGRIAQKPLSRRITPAAGIVGMALLVLLVPARRFFFNTDGVALALVVVAVVFAALALGAVFDMKAGFCNAICPVLPVERLYGQHPLIDVSNPRCLPCTLCTSAGCIDLGPQKSVAQTLGPARRSRAWVTRPFGIFAAGFPGFVIGYYTTQDVPVSGAGDVYLHVLTWVVLSFVVVSVAVLMLNLSARVAITALAGAAAALYYWYAGPLVATTLGVAGVGTGIIRGAAWVLIAVWLWRAFRGPGRRPDVDDRQMATSAG